MVHMILFHSQILSLPDFKTCYYVKGFPIGQKVLVDSVQQRDARAAAETQIENSTVQELLLIGLGYQKTRPYLMVSIYWEYFLGPKSHLKRSAVKEKNNF